MTKLFNPESLGYWARLAYDYKLQPEIFKFALFIDMELEKDKKETEYLGTNIKIVSPNIFIGGELYSIIPYMESEDGAVLADKLNDLYYKIMFQDIMTCLSGYLNEDNERYYYRTGNAIFAHIHSAFTGIIFHVDIEFKNKEIGGLNIIYTNGETGEKLNFHHASSLAEYFVSNTIKDYTFDRLGRLISSIVFGCGGDNRGRDNYSASTSIVFDRIIEVNIGEMKCIKNLADTSTDTCFISGNRIKRQSLFSNKNREVMREILVQNKEEVYEYLYFVEIISALYKSKSDQYKAKKIIKEIHKSDSVARYLENAAQVEIETSHQVPIAVLRIRADREGVKRNEFTPPKYFVAGNKEIIRRDKDGRIPPKISGKCINISKLDDNADDVEFDEF